MSARSPVYLLRAQSRSWNYRCGHRCVRIVRASANANKNADNSVGSSCAPHSDNAGNRRRPFYPRPEARAQLGRHPGLIRRLEQRRNSSRHPDSRNSRVVPVHGNNSHGGRANSPPLWTPHGLPVRPLPVLYAHGHLQPRTNPYRV